MRYVLPLVKRLELLDSVAVRLTVLTGKSRYPIHPKHLVHLGPLWIDKYLKKNDLVLDLGCDNGMHTLKAARKVKNIIGIDYQPKSLNVARSLAESQNIRNVSFLEGNLEKKLPFSSKSFNKILFLDVLEHLHHRTQILDESYRVLKIHGLLMLSIPNSETSWKKLLRRHKINSFADPDHKIEYTKKEAIKACEDTGFRIINIKPITLDTPLSPVFGLIGGLSLNLYQRLLSWKKDKMRLQPEDSVGFRIVAQKA